MDTNGSFFQNGLPISTQETGLGNVTTPTPSPNPANSSFYLSGTEYATLESADVLLAAITAQQQEATAEAEASLASATASNISALAAATQSGLALIDETAAAASAAAALASQNSASASATLATNDAAAALASQLAAAASAGTATTQASIATSEAATATTEANTATTEAGIATTQASNALTSANSAASSASAAAASLAAMSPSNATPIVDGTATPGVSTLFSRGDHVHPTDASRAPLASPVFTGTPEAPTPTAGDNSVNIATTAFLATALAAFTNTTSLTTLLALKAPLASPALTGTPTAPTASAGTNTTQIATTAFVLTNGTNLGSTTPLMDGTAAVGTATAAAHADHVHPSDTSRAPLASPAFTGTPTAPTASPGTNSTQIATTAFVLASTASAGVSSIAGNTGAFTLGVGLTNAVNVLKVVLSLPDVIVEEQQPSGTSAGTFTSGAYQTRLLNTFVRNNGTIASLASNQVTLPAGTYYFSWSAPATNCAQHQTKLRNVTSSTDVEFGSSAFAATTGAITESRGSTVVTLAGSTTFSLMHRCTTTSSGDGFGLACGFGNIEVYSRLEITKLA